MASALQNRRARLKSGKYAHPEYSGQSAKTQSWVQHVKDVRSSYKKGRFHTITFGEAMEIASKSWHGGSRKPRKPRAQTRRR